MGKDTNIGWTDATWNIAVGCDRVSEGCEFCYMMRDGEKYGQDRIGNVVKTKGAFQAPLTWIKRHEFLHNKAKSFKLNNKEITELMHLIDLNLVFTSSLTDVFHPAIDAYRSEMWDIIRKTPFTYQILTKRIERADSCFPPDWGIGYPNVWLGATTENQKNLDTRGQILCETHARTRFLSIEPILGEIDLEDLFKSYPGGIHWAILGGESGFDPPSKWRFRKSRIEWYVKVIEQCREHGVSVFVKQLGTHLARELGVKGDRNGTDINNLPEALRVREFPRKIMTPLD